MRSLAAFLRGALLRPAQEAQSEREVPLELAVRSAQALSVQAEQVAPLALVAPFPSVVPQALSAPAAFSRASPVPSAGSEHPASEFLRIRSAWAVLSASVVPILLGDRFPAPHLSAVLPLKLAGQAFLFLPFPQSESRPAFLQKALLRFPC